MHIVTYIYFIYRCHFVLSYLFIYLILLSYCLSILIFQCFIINYFIFAKYWNGRQQFYFIDIPTIITAIVYIFDFIVYVLHDINIMFLRTILSAKFTSSTSILWTDNKVIMIIIISYLINGFQEHLSHIGICLPFLVCLQVLKVHRQLGRVFLVKLLWSRQRQQ